MNKASIDSFSAFDYDLALKACGDDETILGETISLFSKQVPFLVNHIETAVESRDGKLLHKAAHTLEELLVHLRAYRSLGYLKDLEASCEEINCDSCHERLNIFKNEIDILLHQLGEASETYRTAAVI